MQETGNNQSQTYNLSIRLHADGFSFYSYNPATTEPVAIEDYIYHEEESVAETLKKAIGQSAIVQKRNNSVVYGLVTGLSMQVPLECFRKEEAHALYRLTYAQEKTGKTYYNILPHLEIAQIFTVDLEVERILSQYFPSIRFYHSYIGKAVAFVPTGQTAIIRLFRRKRSFRIRLSGTTVMLCQCLSGRHGRQCGLFYPFRMERPENGCTSGGMHTIGQRQYKE